MKDNKNYIKKEDFSKLIDAVDVVCGECLYRSERTGSKCPVRKTMDRTEESKKKHKFIQEKERLLWIDIW